MDLNMEETPSKVHAIFEEHGIDESAKKLASKLKSLSTKKKGRDKISVPDAELLDVCQKIGRGPSAISLWLKLIAVDSEIDTHPFYERKKRFLMSDKNLAQYYCFELTQAYFSKLIALNKLPEEIQDLIQWNRLETFICEWLNFT